VLVTHEAEIAAHAGRVVIFRDGRVVGDSARPPPSSPTHPAAYPSLAHAVG
jgi:ABC-type lipoprotein export system ATPase subunit